MMNKNRVAEIVDEIFEITKPMYEATDRNGGASPTPSFRRGLIAEILVEALKGGLRHESGRIAYERDNEDDPDIQVYFRVGTIRGAPSFEA